MSLPTSRQVVYGRTFASSYAPESFDPIDRPEPKAGRRVADVAFGLALAFVVCLTLWVLLVYGAVPA